MEKRYRFGSAFQKIVDNTRGQKKWYQVDWRRNCTITTGYVACSSLSFFLMALFGALNMKITSECAIHDPNSRCCDCPTLSAAHFDGQSMPKIDAWNDVFYGVMMIVNSGFGAYYIWAGVKHENKYLLFCMIATQALECFRGLVDVILEAEDVENAGMRILREVVMILACITMFGSWAFLHPVYKKFGWHIFRRGGAKKNVREMFKTYQRFRAFNRLDVQSSALLFVIFACYLSYARGVGVWVFIVMAVLDIASSGYLVKYYKREDKFGVLCSIAGKLFVVVWWLCVLQKYWLCYSRFGDSMDRTIPWLKLDAPVDFSSIRLTYNGVSCLADSTTHDARTQEVVIITLVQALLFRFFSLGVSFFVYRNFGKGMKDIFYTTQTAAQIAAAKAGKPPNSTSEMKLVEEQQMPPPEPESSNINEEVPSDDEEEEQQQDKDVSEQLAW